MNYASKRSWSITFLIIYILWVLFFITGCKEDDQYLYWENGNIQYSGDLVSGVPHGFGTWYYPDGKAAYEGEWKNGRIHGNGNIFCCKDGSTLYSGEFYEGACDGWGVRYEGGELIYEGEWQGGMICEDEEDED